MSTPAEATSAKAHVEAARAVTVMFQRGDVVEVRVPKAGRLRTMSGYFDDLKALVDALGEVDGKGPGVYITLNPVKPDLLARASNRVKPYAEITTRDADILVRRWMLVDCDPERPTGISSNAQELKAARDTTAKLREYLHGYGWPDPIFCLSGNGYHLLYRLPDLPNNDASTSLIRRVLQALSARFSSDTVHIDETVFNAARVSKAYGTFARKGDHTPQRPYRLSRMLEVPDPVAPVSLELLEQVAAEASEARATAAEPAWNMFEFDVEAWIAKVGLDIEKGPSPYREGRRWTLAACPFDSSHTGGSAAIFESSDGVPGFKCQHNSCRGKGWKDVRCHLDPDYAAREQQQRRHHQQGAPHVQAAVALVTDLDKRLQGDVGAAFDPEIVSALAVVQRHDPASWTRAKRILQKRHVSVREVQAAITATRGTEPQPDTAERAAADVLPDCPAPWMLVPAGFSLDSNGTYEWKARRDRSGVETVSPALVAHAPIVIGARFRDVETGTEALRIHWRRPDGWRERTVDRGVALDIRRIIELAGEGFPVSSNNVTGLTKYLADAEALNWSAMPTALVSSHLGWQGRHGDHGFLAGRTLVAPSGELIATARTLDTQGVTIPPGAVSFRGITAGDEQIVDAWHARGTLDQWRRAVSVLRDHPRVLAGLYGAFVPPLLVIMRCPNFIMDWAYRTSAGKTTTLRVAASVWGNPNEDEPDAALRSWDSTQVYIERAAAILSGLPLILDETKRVKDPRLVANIMYEVATGQGRGRGNVRSTAGIRTWRTVLLSTGEVPAVSFTQDGGTRARCLEIRGAPFGSTSPATAAMVNELNMAIKGNYGHAGAEFVGWLLRHRNDWPRIQDEYRATVAHYCKYAPADADHAVVSRLAQYAAALHLAAVYAHVALDLPWALENPLHALWADVVTEASDAAGEERALRDVLSWTYSHSQSFYGHHVKDVDRKGQELEPKMPPGGWSGRWDGKDEDWQFIAFFPTVLQKVLTDLGYCPEAVLAGWKERGWLLLGGDRKGYTTRQRVADVRAYVVAIRSEAIDAVEGRR
jgi:hypothetical protein